MPPYVFATGQTDDSLSIADCANPALPVLVGNIRGAGATNFLDAANKIKVHGDYAYIVARNEPGLTIINISNLALPVYAGGLYGAPNFLDIPWDIFIGNGTFNGLAYIPNVAGGALDGLTIVNISDPANPTYVGGLYGAGAPNFLDSARSVYVRGDYAYVSVGQSDNRLTIINVSNPAAPTFVASLATGNNGNHIMVRGDYAYITHISENSLRIYNIANPAAPVMVGVINGIGAPNYLWGAWRVALWDDYAFVCAAQDDAITVINVANPAVPTHVVSILNAVGGNAFDGPRDIVIQYPYAYVGASSDTGFGNRMSVIDITDPAAPTYEGALLGPGAPNYMKGCQGVSLKEFFVPQVQADPATDIAANSSTLNGTLNADGGEACDCGFEWGETVAYGNTTPTQSRTTGQTFLQVISGLDPAKTYHFRAFATNAAGTSYSTDRTFTTLGAISTVTTDPATGVGMVLADINGTLDDDGGVACDCGFEWGETVAYGNTTPTQSKVTGEAFSQAISGLTPGTTYHFRAFSTNVIGTSYGADRTFTTGEALSRGYALSRHEL